MVRDPVRCQFQSHMTPIPASVIYPELPDPLTTGDLQQLFSPYATSKLKRFGDYPTDLKPESMPACMTLPIWDLIEVAGFHTNLTDGPCTFWISSMMSNCAKACRRRSIAGRRIIVCAEL